MTAPDAVVIGSGPNGLACDPRGRPHAGRQLHREPVVDACAYKVGLHRGPGDRAVVMTELEPHRERVVFQTRESGVLAVTHDGARFTLDLRRTALGAARSWPSRRGARRQPARGHRDRAPQSWRGSRPRSTCGGSRPIRRSSRRAEGSATCSRWRPARIPMPPSSSCRGCSHQRSGSRGSGDPRQPVRPDAALATRLDQREPRSATGQRARRRAHMRARGRSRVDGRHAVLVMRGTISW